MEWPAHPPLERGGGVTFHVASSNWFESKMRILLQSESLCGDPNI